MKRLLYFPLIILLIVFTVFSVSKFIDRPPVSEIFTVGVVLPEGADAAHMEVVMNDVGVQEENLHIRENVTSASAKAAMEELMEAGCLVIFCMDPAFEDAMHAAAADAPQVEFFCYQGYQAPMSELTNVHDFTFAYWQPAFAAGVLAGYTTESGVLAHLMPSRSHQEIALANSYYLGAIAVRDVTLYVRSTEDPDPLSVSDDILALADTHADVFSASLAHEELSLIREVSEDAAYMSFVGADGLMSWEWDESALFATVLYPYLADREIPASTVLGLEACNVGLSKTIPEEDRAAVEQVLKDIEDGAITLDEYADAFAPGGIVDITN